MTHNATALRRAPDRSVLQSVQRAAAVMNEIARHHAPASIAELASALQLERTIVHRIVRTLESEQLVESAATGGYTLGPRTLLLGNCYLDNLSVRGLALPYLVDLTARVIGGRPWTASLIVRIDNEAMLVETVYNTAAPLDIQLWMGHRFPIDKTAAGRGMLAYMSPEQAADLIGESTAHELADEFERIRQAGGIASLRGMYRDLSAMSATILDRASSPVAGVVVAGLDLDDHLTPDSSLARALRRTAGAIARVLP
jgi:DNA-binding IclR family transcriptional regulator